MYRKNEKMCTFCLYVVLQELFSQAMTVLQNFVSRMQNKSGIDVFI